MGKFDGYLICSDLDGTFNQGEYSINVNSEAVEYFIKNGGRFTFATGRATSHLRSPEFFQNINAPACICNGGVIYDYENEKILREERVKFTFGEFLDEIALIEHKPQKIFLFNSCIEASVLIDDFKGITDDMLKWHPIKIVCAFDEVTEAYTFKSLAKESEIFKASYISNSWQKGVEFNSDQATKGQAVDYIKNYLGNIHTAVGVGDYENDLTLLEYADIGAAPENAIDLLKDIADIKLKPAAEGAIADLIEKLEKGLK